MKFIPPWPLRFRTKEDAMLWIKCCQTREPFPPDKIVYPFVKQGCSIMLNREYAVARFEQTFVEKLVES